MENILLILIIWIKLVKNYPYLSNIHNYDCENTKKNNNIKLFLLLNTEYINKHIISIQKYYIIMLNLLKDLHLFFLLPLQMILLL